jgi:hypothetical protein
LQIFLQARLGVLVAGCRRIDGRQQRPVEIREYFLCRREAAVEADGADQGFECIGKDGWSAKSTTLEFPLAKPQVIAERQRSRQLRQRLLVDQPGAQPRQVALG